MLHRKLVLFHGSPSCCCTKRYEMLQLNTHRPRVDRFVTPRESFPELHRRAVWKTNKERPADIWNGKYLKHKKYISYIDEALGLEPLSSESPSEPAWPCVPRKKCYLSTADSILDLPTYSSATFPELLDWSNDNILIAALGRNYHKWSWHSQSLIAQGFTDFTIFCCKYDPRGELLLIGTDLGMVEIHDNALTKCIYGNACQCLERKYQDCEITAVDWSPTGNSFVAGCSRGKLTSFSRRALTIEWAQAVVDGTAVLAVRVSPDARFVAASSVDGDGVTVLTWPALELYSRLRSVWSVRTLAWHPWRSALLAIGSITPDLHARLAVWDAPSDKVQQASQYRTAANTKYCLDTMLFSKKTGELVLSLWNSGEPKASSLLAVLSDPETIVDQYGEGGLDRVRTMVFSPDGTKLATATADEDLIIWNFLPEDRLKKKVACRRFSSLPVYLDNTEYGYSVR